MDTFIHVGALKSHQNLSYKLKAQTLCLWIIHPQNKKKFGTFWKKDRYNYKDNNRENLLEG